MREVAARVKGGRAGGGGNFKWSVVARQVTRAQVETSRLQRLLVVIDAVTAW